MLDVRVTAVHVEAHALLAVLEIDICNLDATTVLEHLPICLEVVALKPRTANLFGEEAVLHRMVDVFEKLAVDSLIDRDSHSVRINEQDGDLGFACS